jgi:hypothetical protein
VLLLADPLSSGGTSALGATTRNMPDADASVNQRPDLDAVFVVR